MKKLVKKYARKLVRQGLCERGAPLVGGIDAKIVWSNPAHTSRKELNRVIEKTNTNNLIFAKPAEPYFSIINILANDALAIGKPVQPQDSETRTFLHDIPVVEKPSAAKIAEALQQRKSVIIAGRGIVAQGSVSPEQAFISFSSTCFACFIKFVSDALAMIRHNNITAKRLKILRKALNAQKRTNTRLLNATPDLAPGPFKNAQEVKAAICEAGIQTVDQRLVDSFFGNISYRLKDTIFITETGASLDELSDTVDACPIDGSSCAGITASSELSAHREILMNTDNKAILHGHPEFAVIVSMLCDRDDCPYRGQCHIKCPYKRFFNDIPIVPGEVGTGHYGLCNTLPEAIRGRRGVIVHGHGLFTVGRKDFVEAFANLAATEQACFNHVLKLAAT